MANRQNNNPADMNTNFISFYKNSGIEIPLIQRDYVQGCNSQAEKRDAFIDSLFGALINANEPCELDFIYGTYNHGAFLPLDGQQRLTTLYLLHWFLMNKSRIDDADKFNNIMKDIELDRSHFSYKTRRSSSEFCKKLNDYHPTSLDYPISKKIKGKTWFSEKWKQDPTIIAMLEMLDALTIEYNKLPSANAHEMLENLVHSKAVNFDELDMGEYKLTDSLYVKMNARGKQLTEFENWKAKFIQYLENNYKDTYYQYAEDNRKEDFGTIKDYFTHSIEHEWTDLLWTYAVNDYKERLRIYENTPEEQKFMIPEPEGPLIDNYFLNLLKFPTPTEAAVRGV